MEEKVKLQVRMPKDLHMIVKAAAEEQGLPMNSFIIQRLISLMKNWTSWKTGERFSIQKMHEMRRRAWQDVWCFHSSHGSTGLPALDCPAQEQHLASGDIMDRTTLEPLTDLPITH